MLNLGVVPYLNALPLYKTLEARDDMQIVAHVPSELSRALEKGDVDVALLPVVEHFRGVGESLISSSCIGCTRDVRSVLLFSRVSFDEIQSVALDTSSRSSVALTRVIFADLFELNPQFHDAPPRLETMLKTCDAALLIGDPALLAAQNYSQNYSQNHSPQLRVLDLGEAWFDLTNLPFVFASWVARKGLKNTEEIALLLDSARDEGMSQISHIAHKAAPFSAFSQEVIESYFRDAIQYEMTDLHRAGMNEFRQRCTRHGLLSRS